MQQPLALLESLLVLPERISSLYVHLCASVLWLELSALHT